MSNIDRFEDIPTEVVDGKLKFRFRDTKTGHVYGGDVPVNNETIYSIQANLRMVREAMLNTKNQILNEEKSMEVIHD